MTQTNQPFEGQDDFGQPRGKQLWSYCIYFVQIQTDTPDIANPASSSPPSESEDSHQFPPSPPGIHDNDQPPLPSLVSTAAALSSSQSPELGDMITLSPQTSPITQDDDTPSLPQRPSDNNVDPRIASLRAMFPDFDDSLLSSVLQSANGDQDLAIDTLLGMSDPDYVSQPLAPPEQREPTQTDLDEQLARRLMLEEEQAAQQQWRPSQQDQGHQSYQPRRSTSTSRGGWGGAGDETGRYDSTAQGGNPPQRDTMADFQDGFNKIAETGKKTFSSIVSKVKAKMQEFDQGQGPPRQDTQPTWGQASQPSWSGGQPHTSSQIQYQPSYHDPNPQPQEPYYDPNPPGDSRIYGSGPTYAGSSMYNPPTTGMGTSPPPELARRSGDIPRPPSTGVGTPSGIDPAKLGLLPKRPVSLLREQPPPSHRDDSDDELEYTENPFEDRGQ
ncbi:uncharacterized protein EDB91DRAFT_1062246 [Suillus paluster]|uniref:uncharacterized protein n=1 Tax=Suillus paluster TaxID=48578 RepID=UPI001B860348|nr:uncharacterized protein EDB91DRAFT_1062246 [Suillus paluster]KAG1725402.1 hypothetical protein EDB91DRAFT_1062246 [Suillus paluster]